MLEIRIHGRGGQGVVTSAELIAIAGFKNGYFSQAIPSFGVERSGAPVQSFARLSEKAIISREHIYEPDILIIQDPTLLKIPATLAGLKKNGRIIVNSQKNKEEIRKILETAGQKIKANNIFPLDGTDIALKTLGKNITNTVTLGALAKIVKELPLSSFKEAIKEKFQEKGEEIINKNIAAIEAAYKQS